jgi:hypothetical protein
VGLAYFAKTGFWRCVPAYCRRSGGIAAYD